MENNIDFKSLWNKQPAPEPDTRELFKKIHRLKARKMRKIIFLNIALIATCLFIAWIWFYFQPQYISTKIGIILAILAMVIFLIATNKDISLYKKANESLSNYDYSKNLLAIKSHEQVIQTTIMNVYFLLLSAGICLYMYEYTSRMTLSWGIFTYAITLLWIGFNWFYTRPRQTRKNKESLDALIHQLEDIQSQMKREDEE